MSTEAKPKAHRGFRAMDKEKQRELASRGGKLAHIYGVAHEFTPEEAREAGRKGGRAVASRPGHMERLAKLGGEASMRAEAERKAAVAAGHLQLTPGQRKAFGDFEEGRSGKELPRHVRFQLSALSHLGLIAFNLDRRGWFFTDLGRSLRGQMDREGVQ